MLQHPSPELACFYSATLAWIYSGVDRHIKRIGGYLRERDVRACEDVLASIRDTLTDLQRFAFLGHEGIVEGTRERSLPGYPYVIVYRVDIDMKRGDEVVILAVFHCAQDR